MTERTGASWLVYALGALSTGAIVAAFLVVGPASPEASAQSRIVTAQRGVVQSTVSGAGNLQAATQLDLGFKTAGVVQHIFVTQGEHVLAGALLAELNPEDAEVTLEQAKASLQAAQATLAQEEESGGETSSAQGSAPAKARTSANAEGKTGATRGGEAEASGSGSEGRKQSAATREANLSSARAAVRSDTLAVQSDEQAVQDTKLYAPSDGTIVALGGEVGESVSGSGTTKAPSSASESSSSGGEGTRGASARGAAGSSASSGAGSSSGSAFAVLSDLSAMKLVVGLSESEVVHVHVGQPATVTVEALEGTKLAARVQALSTLPTSTSGVVSYDVTFALAQLAPGLKPGMSASAEVVVEQAEGVNVPSTAISRGTVTVVTSTGRRVTRTVRTGFAGNSTTIVLSGLAAGEKVALPLSASANSATNVLSRLGGRGGRGALGTGALGGGLGGGGGAGGGLGVAVRGGG